MYRAFRGVFGVYMVVYTCITGVHRCTYGNAGVTGVTKGVYRVYNMTGSH